MTGTVEGEAFLDPEASRDYLRSWKERVDTLAARTQAMSDQLGQLRMTARDDNDLAEATVDSTGVLVDLKLTPRMHRFEPDVLARAVLTAQRKARLLVADRSKEIAEQTLGPDSLTARTVAERMRQQLQAADRPGDPPPGDPYPDAGTGRIGGAW